MAKATSARDAVSADVKPFSENMVHILRERRDHRAGEINSAQ